VASRIAWMVRTGIAPVLFFVLGLAWPSPLAAQFVVRSWLDWRTIETRRFAFHYPAELETWTRATASRVEAIDSAVSSVVGYSPRAKTQVVVDDPYALPNGMAWPFLDQPAITLWASAPTPRDDIGEFRSWGEMLISHEFAHIAHLSRPSRNSGARRLAESMPVDLGPIALRAPRWVIEGYATYVEGRVTGSGRPHGMWRAAFLRQWALEGQLPRYEQLNGSSVYEGGNFAYVVGSAFLEWLAARQGDSSLVHLWRRMSARQNRDFDEAFVGVFGESAAALYGKFVVDVTARALSARQAIRAAGMDTGTIEQRLSRDTGDPAISADGTRIVLVVRSPVAPSRVVIWDTAPEPDTGRARRDSVLLARDPEDVPARPIYPPPRRALATLRSPGASYEGPRFLADGRVLLWKPTPRGDGSLVTDLFVWDPRRHSVTRVTRDASLRDADPAPDGRSAVATRCRLGWCDLVSVDLGAGTVTMLVPGSPARSFYRPRLRPGSGDVIVSVHDGTRWRLALLDAASRSLRMLDVSDGTNRYDAAWMSATRIVDVGERDGVANLETFDIGDPRPVPITSVTGAAVAPEPQPRSSSIWFLSLYSRGYDVRRVEAPPAQAPAAPGLTAALAPASPPPAFDVSFGANAVSPPRPFGVGPQFIRWFPQPSLDADGASAALSISSRDIVGRGEVLGTIAGGDAAAWRGGSLTATWRGFLPAVRVDAFAAAQHLGDSRLPIASALSPSDPARRRFDTRLTGLAASLDRSYQLERWAARYRIGASVARLRDSAAAVPSSTSARALALAEGGLALVQRGDAVTFTESLSGSVATGRSLDTRFSRGVVSATLASSGRRALPLSATASYGRSTTDAPAFEQFALGGGPSLVVDRLLLSQRIAMPVLPAAVSIGSSAFTYRGAYTAGPLAAYLWSGSTAPAGERFTAWHRVLGLEWVTSVPPIAAVGTPAARAQIGVGESLDAPIRKKVRAYVSLVLNP